MRAILALFLLLALFPLPVWPNTPRTHNPGLSSGFGWRFDPLNGHSRFHGGIDIPAKPGIPIYATQAGYVVYSGWYGGYGKLVALAHGDGLFTLYGHASSLLVKEGQYVRKGQVIAAVGSTGHSTGSHLHFEVHRNGKYENPISYLVTANYE